MELKQYPSIDSLWPDSARIHPSCVEIGGQWTRSYRIVGFPRRVEPGWFEPFLRFPWPITVNIFTEPLENREVLPEMNRRLLLNRGIEEANQSLGRLSDPGRKTAIDDTEQLRTLLVRGDTRLFGTGILLTVWASSLEELDFVSDLLESQAAGMMILLRLLRYRQIEGIRRVIPLGVPMEALRDMDSHAWATLFPFTSQDFIHPRGIVYGINGKTRSLVIVDRFQMPSPHSITIGWSGSGKSFSAKLEAMRARYWNIPVSILDPEGEYHVLEEAGADIWRVGDVERGRFPFDPFQISHEDSDDVVERHADFLIRFILRLQPQAQVYAMGLHQVMGSFIKDHAKKKRTFHRGDTICTAEKFLQRVSELIPHAHLLVESAVVRWYAVSGQIGNASAFQVFDLSRLTSQMKSAAYLALTEWLSRNTRTISRQLVIFDEAWHLLTEADTATYLEELFRRARKWGTAISLITQDIGDFTRNRAAEVCLRNAPIIQLMRQHPESLREISELLHLHEGELEIIQQASPGEGLLMVGDDHIPIRVIASPMETKWLMKNIR